MSKRKSAKNQSIKEFRHDLAILKKQGLVSSKINAKTQKPTKYMKSQVRKYSDVIEGRAKAVKVGTANTKDAPYRMRAKLGRIVLPIKKGDILKYDRKTNTIKSTRFVYDIKSTRLLPIKPPELEHLENVKARPGKRLRYKVYMGRYTEDYDSLDALLDAMVRRSPKFKQKDDWLERIEYEEVDDREAA